MEKKGQHWAKGQLGQQIFNDKNRTNQPTQMLPEINISQQKNQEPQEIFAN